jgi:malic enzyme
VRELLIVAESGVQAVAVLTGGDGVGVAGHREAVGHHREAVGHHIERPRRVALVCDTGARAEHSDPESAAAFLRYHSGLEITPLTVDARDGSLAEAIAELGPGYTAVCLHHARPEHVDAVRRRLSRSQPDLPVLDTGDDGGAVAMVAALINAVRRARATFAGARVLIIDADAAPGIGALLTAAGVRDLTFADRRTADAVLDDMPAHYDALIDLSIGATGPHGRRPGLVPPDITLTFEPGADEPGPGAIVATGPNRVHPLLALPGLLSVAVRHRVGIDVTDRFAAAHALARLAPPGELLPDARDPRITAAVYDAAARPVRPRPTE